MIAGGQATDDCEPATFPTATRDDSLNSIFYGQDGPGWLGGDATYSTALPNGREAFVFSDTLVGTGQTNGVAKLTGVAHNSEMTGTLSNLVDHYRGKFASPDALIPESNENDPWQVASTYMENGNQLVFVNQFAPVAGSLFDTYTGRSGIAVMSLSSGQPTLSRIQVLPTDPLTEWGNAMMQSGGYDYVYGMSMDFTTDTYYGMKVARVPVGDSLVTADWTYWNGSSWVPGETNAVAPPDSPLVDGVIPLESGTGFMAVGVGGYAGQTMSVGLTFSCSPTGPWSPARTVFSIHQTTRYANELAYIATFHPELSSAEGGLVVSYNLDSMNGLSAVEKNDHEYRPRFIVINGLG